jgi:hypothetical protein
MFGGRGGVDFLERGPEPFSLAPNLEEDRRLSILKTLPRTRGSKN